MNLMIFIESYGLKSSWFMYTSGNYKNVKDKCIGK